MPTESPLAQSVRETIEVDGALIEFFRCENRPAAPVIGAAHPASVFGAGTAALLAESAQASVVCVNARGLGGSSPARSVSFERMVDDIENVRQSLGIGPWIFWGMSGGGWLGQLYGRRYPESLAGLIVESACACFRERLADPTCVLSPFSPAWRDALEARGLVVAGSHANPGAPEDAEWCEVEGVGSVMRRRDGPALLVSPMAIDPEMKRALPAMWTFDSRSWLGELRVPALVLAGSADPVVPVDRVREVHRLVAGSAFAVVEGGGHVPSAERKPEAIGRVRAFVAEVGS